MYKKPMMNAGADSQTRPVAKLPSELVVKEAFSPHCQTLPATMSPTELVVKRLSAPYQNEAKTLNKKWEDNGKIRNKYYDICNNCGKQGHAFKQCKNPITSFGVIVFRINQNQRQYLMIRRKDTLGYIDFMRGKYSVTNHKYILNMLKQMTVSEKYKLSTFTFDNLWHELWSGSRITADISDNPEIETHCPTDTINNSYRQEETNSRDKFLYLSTKAIGNCSQTSPVCFPNSSGSKGGFQPPLPKSLEEFGKGQNATELLTSKGALHLEPAKRVPSCYADPDKFGSSNIPEQTVLQYLLMISNIPETLKSDADPIPQEGGGWLEPEWGFPKGRRNYQEKDYECALREMMEETGYSPNNVKNIKNIIPFDEIFLGSNYKSYKHRYYLMYMNYHDSLSMDNFEKSEVSCMEWKSYDECMKSIRSYNLEKKRLITNIEQTLSKYRLFFHPNTM